MKRDPDQLVTAAAPRRLCSTCGENPPLGALPRCKACIQRSAAEARSASIAAETRVRERKHAAIDAAGQTKPCRCCKQDLALYKFAKWATAKDGLRRDCIECISVGATKTQRTMTAEQKAADKQRRAKPHRLAANRKAVANWSARNADAVKAKRKLLAAVKSGIVAKPSRCQAVDCKCRGSLQAHHPDYAFPLVVAWVCPGHHRKIHAGVEVQIVTGLPQMLSAVPASLA